MSRGFFMANGDAVVGKTIGTVEGNEMLRQTLQMVIGTNKGEWQYDPLEGIDRSVILKKNPDADAIRGTIEEAIRHIDDTLTMTDFSLTVDDRRRASIRFLLVKPGGESVEVNQTYGS